MPLEVISQNLNRFFTIVIILKFIDVLLIESLNERLIIVINYFIRWHNNVLLIRNPWIFQNKLETIIFSFNYFFFFCNRCSASWISYTLSGNRRSRTSCLRLGDNFLTYEMKQSISLMNEGPYELITYELESFLGQIYPQWLLSCKPKSKDWANEWENGNELFFYTDFFVISFLQKC